MPGTTRMNYNSFRPPQSAFKQVWQMTFRAFLALRVIGMQWKSCQKEVVKKIESSQTKSKISQNLNWEMDAGAIFQPSLGPKVSRNVFGYLFCDTEILTLARVLRSRSSRAEYNEFGVCGSTWVEYNGF